MKTTVLLAIFIYFFCASASNVAAQTFTDGCSQVGQCVDGKVCGYLFPNYGGGLDPNIVGKTNENCGGGVGRSVLGGIPVPMGVMVYNISAGGLRSGIGIIAFVSNLLNLFAIVAGLWVLVNIIRAAYLFITGMGDPGTFQKVQELATMSGFGVAIIAGAYIIAGLVGLIIFGRADFILNPTLIGALD